MFRVSADLPFQNEIEHKSTGLSNLYLAAFTGAQAPPFAGYGWHHRRVVLLVSILGVTISKEEKKWTLHNCIKTAFKTPQSNNKKQANKETARETMFNEWDQRNGDKVALHSSRWPDSEEMTIVRCCQELNGALIPSFSIVPPDIIKRSYWHRLLLRNETINPVAMRQPHQTDNLLSWCILHRRCPALALDHTPHSLPHPSGSGRRPSSASVWRRPGEGRGYFWHAET